MSHLFRPETRTKTIPGVIASTEAIRMRRYLDRCGALGSASAVHEERLPAIGSRLVWTLSLFLEASNKSGHYQRKPVAFRCARY